MYLTRATYPFGLICTQAQLRSELHAHHDQCCIKLEREGLDSRRTATTVIASVFITKERDVDLWNKLPPASVLKTSSLRQNFSGIRCTHASATKSE